MSDLGLDEVQRDFDKSFNGDQVGGTYYICGIVQSPQQKVSDIFYDDHWQTVYPMVELMRHLPRLVASILIDVEKEPPPQHGYISII